MKNKSQHSQNMKKVFKRNDQLRKEISQGLEKTKEAALTCPDLLKEVRSLITSDKK